MNAAALPCSRIVTCLVALVALGAVVAPSQPLVARGSQDAPATVVSLEAVAKAERARFAALVAGDYATMGAMLGDDLIYTHSTGTVDTKNVGDMAPLVSGRTRYVQADATDARIVLYGTTAVTTGVVRVTAHVGSDVRPSHLRYTSVWTVRDGRWQMVAWQATRLP